MNDVKSCSFCGSRESQSNPLIAGQDVDTFICKACVMTAHGLLKCDTKAGESDEAESLSQSAEAQFNIPSPRELHAKLNEYVIGQESAKKIFCVAVYNHYRRIADSAARGDSKTESEREFDDIFGGKNADFGVKNGGINGAKNGEFNAKIGAKNTEIATQNTPKTPSKHAKIPLDPSLEGVEIAKSNMLLIGPTGSGKTLLAQTLARFLDIPIAISDATSLTEAGYVGEDVENILTRLIQAADGDIKKAERGIVFIDEVDKIARLGENRSITRDVSGEGVQQALLKIIEGSVVNVPPKGGRKHPNQDFIQIDTSNILFICGGAFDGITDIIKRRLGERVLGFSERAGGESSVNEKELLHLIDSEDLVHYGLIPELIGRLHVVATLDEISKEAMVNILTKPKNALVRQYQKIFALDGAALKFEQDAIEAIAELALEKKTGARGLRSIVERVMNETMYDLPDLRGYQVVITKACVKEGAKPVLVKGLKGAASGADGDTAGASRTSTRSSGARAKSATKAAKPKKAG